MNAADEISIYTLQEEAKKSDDSESFRALAKISNCRIGIGARVESPKNPSFFREVLVSLCIGHDPVDLDLIERKLSLLKRLEQKGYVLNCEEDGCVSCELTVQSKDLIAEFKDTSSMIERFLKTRNGRSLGKQSNADRNGGD